MRSEICKDNIIERRLRSQVVMSILRSYDNEETYIDPIWFSESWNHENSEERCNWREAIRDEINTMELKNVWTTVPKSEVDSIKKILTMKWVFKRKSKVKYRARLVAKGFQQVEGVDYIFSHSPVLTNSTIRMMLILSMSKGMSLMALDITKAFLESPLEDEVYINYPPGYKDIKGSSINKSTCLKLNKAVYGLVQASKCFYNRLTKYYSVIDHSSILL